MRARFQKGAHTEKVLNICKSKQVNAFVERVLFVQQPEEGGVRFNLIFIKSMSFVSVFVRVFRVQSDYKATDFVCAASRESAIKLSAGASVLFCINCLSHSIFTTQTGDAHTRNSSLPNIVHIIEPSAKLCALSDEQKTNNTQKPSE